MTLREIQNNDLKVTKGSACSNGAMRVFVSLKGASFVNKTFWLFEADLAKPETLARIKKATIP